MGTKRFSTLFSRFVLVLLIALLPTALAASSVFTGHKAERRVILISGYDACNNLPISAPYACTQPQSRDAQHNQSTELLGGWGTLRNFLTQDDPNGPIERTLVRTIANLDTSKVFFFSYSGNYVGGNNYTQPDYKAKDTCLTASGNLNKPGYCQVEKSGIERVTRVISDIIQSQPNDTEFDIIGHSEGGLVATYWGATASDDLLRRVNSIITLDSPLSGVVVGPVIGLVPFTTEEVTKTIALAPSRVPVYSIRNTVDLAVPWSEATLGGVWNDSGLDITVFEGGLFHEPRNDGTVHKRIALALVSGKVIEPTTEKPAFVQTLLGAASSFDAQMAKPTFSGHDLSTSDFHTSIGGQSAGVGLAWGRALGYTPFTGGRVLLKINPPVLAAAPDPYDLTVDTYNSQVNQVPTTDTESRAVRYVSVANVDVVLVIDHSGSMGGQKLNDAKAAAKAFVEFMHVGDKVGVVSYDDTATVNFPLTTITSDTTRQAAKAAIDAISVGGNTSIGGGLQAGLNQLNTSGDPSHSHAMALLTDGQENTAPFVANVLPAVKQAGVSVDTIGLGSGVNEVLLLDIASQTGGTYHFAPSSWDLFDIYLTIVSRILGQQIIFLDPGLLVTSSRSQGPINAALNTTDVPVTIDSSVLEATFILNWTNASVNLDLVLVKPDGTIIAPPVTDPNIRYVAGPTYKFFEIKSPPAGQWLMRVTQTTPGPAEPFNVRVSAVAGLRIDFGTNRNTYFAREPILLAASLADTQPILGATVNATIKRPDGSTATLALFDDGTHLDSTAGDGIYANTFADTVQVGSYSISFSATGVSNTGERFTRAGQSTVVVQTNPALPADLFITKTGVSQIQAGATLVYTITYGNNGPGNATDVAITDLFPAGTTYVADSLGSGVDISGVGRSWTIGSLAASVQNTFTLTVSVPSTITGGTLLTDTASIFIQPPVVPTTLAAPDPNFGNNVATVTTSVTARRPVGGYLVPVSKLELLAPWLSLGGLLTLVVIGIVLTGRRRT
jgi:uncharacterized repeat protein (TIGR01451 family)